MTYLHDLIASGPQISETDSLANVMTGLYRGRVSCAVTAVAKYGLRLGQLALPLRRVTRAADRVTVVCA
jgi:hypothetical protein